MGQGQQLVEIGGNKHYRYPLRRGLAYAFTDGQAVMQIKAIGGFGKNHRSGAVVELARQQNFLPISAEQRIDKGTGVGGTDIERADTPAGKGIDACRAEYAAAPERGGAYLLEQEIFRHRECANRAFAQPVIGDVAQPTPTSLAHATVVQRLLRQPDLPGA